ncbi:MAG: hypothetical protein WCN95_15945, partial [bacterium]
DKKNAEAAAAKEAKDTEKKAAVEAERATKAAEKQAAADKTRAKISPALLDLLSKRQAEWSGQLKEVDKTTATGGRTGQ